MLTPLPLPIPSLSLRFDGDAAAAAAVAASGLVLLRSGGRRRPRQRPRREGQEGKIWREEAGETRSRAVAKEKGVEAHVPLLGVAPPSRDAARGREIDGVSEGRRGRRPERRRPRRAGLRRPGHRPPRRPRRRRGREDPQRPDEHSKLQKRQENGEVLGRGSGFSFITWGG